MKKLFFGIAALMLILILAKQTGIYISNNGFKIPRFEITLEAWGILIAGLGGAALAIDTISSQKFSSVVESEIKKIEAPAPALWHAYTTAWTFILSAFFALATIAVAFGTLHQGYEVFVKKQYDFLNVLDLILKLTALVAVPTMKVAVLTVIWHLPDRFDAILLQYKEKAEDLRIKIKSVGWKLFVIGSVMQFMANIDIG